MGKETSMAVFLHSYDFYHFNLMEFFTMMWEATQLKTSKIIAVTNCLFYYFFKKANKKGRIQATDSAY